MNISMRLKTIADMIPDGVKVIDVGCDHGLLSIYLSKYKNCTVIATDIRESALESAIKNIKKYNISNITTLVTDGINNIKIEDEDYIVISGMGTHTIKHILNDKKLSQNLIISSQKNIDELREYMVSIGYKIKDERFIIDKDKEYVIIHFIKGKVEYNIIEYEYGPILLHNLVYIKHIINQKQELLNKIPSTSCDIQNKLLDDINILKEYIK